MNEGGSGRGREVKKTEGRGEKGKTEEDETLTIIMVVKATVCRMYHKLNILSLNELLLVCNFLKIES